MQTSEQIIQVLNAFCEKFGIIIDWTTTNINEAFNYILPKLIKYEVLTSLYFIFMGSIFILTTYFVFSGYTKNKIGKKLKDFTTKDYYGDTINTGQIIICVIGVILTILSFVGIIMILDQATDIVKCLAFPELYTIETIKKLINGVH